MVFDRRVSQAIDIIYNKREYKKGQQAIELLKEAADEGDGDAYFFLARCYAGPEFADDRFNFTEDHELTTEYFNRSIESGSAVGMFASRRFGGFRPRCGSYINEPYNSDREIWDEVARLALEGELFCEYLIANAYYYGDAIELLEIDMESLDQSERVSIFKNMALTALSMYEDLMSKGFFMGYYNYKDIITSGDFGIPKDKNRLNWLKKVCAKRGIEI